MKIDIITSRYPSENSPYNHMFVHVRCVEFMKLGCEVNVFVPSNNETIYFYENVKVIKAPARTINLQISNKSIVYLHLLNIYPFSKTNGWIIYQHIIRARIPFAMFIHGSEVQRYSARLFEFNYRFTDLLKWIKKDVFVIPKMRKFFRNTINDENARFIFPSIWMREEAERNLKISFLKNYKIIPTGIETNYFKFNNCSQNKFKIVTIRSLSNKVYDIEKSIKVISLLPSHFTLDIFGEGIYKDRYNHIIKDLGLDKRVKIVSGFVEKDDMRRIFSDYGIYISTTKMDSQGVNMMEAMAAGLVVATTDNSSKREFISNLENGTLGKDASEIAFNILKLTSNSENFIEIARKGREFTESINISKTVKKELVLLKNLALING